MTKILLIENSSSTKQALKQCLSTKSFKIIEAKSGYIGIQKARKYLPDIIVCNTDVPKINGFQVLEALRKTTSTVIIPFILLANKNAETEFRQAMLLGADDCLIRPFTSVELAEAIAAQLKKRLLFKQWFPFQFQQVSQQEMVEIEESAAGDRQLYSCPHLKKVFDFIEAHYHEAISLRDVAKEVGFSSTYLTELVKRKTGTTVNRWIIKRRLTAACIQLLETNNSIEFIAESVGYNNLTHFFNQFRKHYQTTPKVWRQTCRQLSTKTRLYSE